MIWDISKVEKFLWIFYHFQFLNSFFIDKKNSDHDLVKISQRVFFFLYTDRKSEEPTRSKIKIDHTFWETPVKQNASIRNYESWLIEEQFQVP